jgi:hypothetical protein
MRVGKVIYCKDFPCPDVRPECCQVPNIEIRPEDVSAVLISEVAPTDPTDYYYAPGDPLFAQTTIQAFRDAGADVSSVHDILELGFYLTTAVKCGKTTYAIKTSTVKQCVLLLEKELDLFPRVKAFLLMGDVAIRAINYIAQRAGQGRVIPAGSTYKIRAGEHYFRGARAFPSYLQAGPSFFIEKSKRRMITQDIAAALALVRGATEVSPGATAS